MEEINTTKVTVSKAEILEALFQAEAAAKELQYTLDDPVMPRTDAELDRQIKKVRETFRAALDLVDPFYHSKK
ncbi:hypothetical protein UFOVP399_22 [uncultured Caudovirales phage]|uniref:Uncharacterized protein n=1 Tax=uncultured Caudovirales phage TaxID=2100421 RepID=A0A6J5M3W6_9CAUD|nr:hypothetical protein UFOVP399_22 [uncultured Caudovirales phage]